MRNIVGDDVGYLCGAAFGGYNGNVQREEEPWMTESSVTCWPVPS